MQNQLVKIRAYIQLCTDMHERLPTCTDNMLDHFPTISGLFQIAFGPILDSEKLIFSKLQNETLPEELDYTNFLMPVRNQGSQGTCYALSAACMKECQEVKDRGFSGYFSPQFLYNHRCNLYDDDTTNDDGMYGRDVMKLLQKVGICEENDYPYNTCLLYTSPSPRDRTRSRMPSSA